MSYPAYPEYKDSGVEWLGEVPAHWDVTPVRAFVEERTAKNPSGDDENYLSLMANVGVIPYAEKGDVGNKKPDDLSKCKKVDIGDLVINSMNYGIGSYGLSGLKGVCSPVYIVLRPMEEKVLPRYALRIFENKEFQKLAQSFGQGILAHRSAIGWDDLKNIKVPMPETTEQAQFSAFLDHETARIDALVEEQQRLIALLKEKRQAVISHAVTKGLDPDVPMKDSGVEWLGEVPAHWGVPKLKHLVRIRNGRDYKIVEVESGGYPVIGSGGEFARANDFLYDGESVLLGRKGTIDKPLYINGPFWTVDTMFYTELSQRVNGRFLYYYATCFQFGQYSTNTALPSMAQEDLANIYLAVPGPPEQILIATFLDYETARIDSLVEEGRSVVRLLQERRSALISAAVTGKIDVRGWQPPEDSMLTGEASQMEVV
ncbi:restriction endonuclease subunit S [Vreelandella aquamarina]|uniref:Restriction endonuclease subunit S n=1 Tax=Vreelandella aquamarina TaxID=77097 RepID=A0A857GMU8_9GAMM|nr:restriction endonuclease subunit S [Halomonas meridiana]QHD49836.1 restriction endonuclease subunit S [Halomonas meridiana]